MAADVGPSVVVGVLADEAAPEHLGRFEPRSVEEGLVVVRGVVDLGEVVPIADVLPRNGARS
jgi:hypothetical protein